MTIDGRKISQRILSDLKDMIKKTLRQNQGKKLRLTAVLVGQNPELKKFLELKKKAAEKIGVGFRQYDFPEDITEEELQDKLSKICEEKNNHGIIIELPLPKNLNTQRLLNLIPEQKDVDVLSEKSQSKFFTGQSTVLPPSVEATKQIFNEYNIDPKDKTAAVFGYGLLVGKFVSHWLKNQGATVSIITENTKEPEEISREAEIIISGVGQPNLIKADMVKEGAVVIDFAKDVHFAAVFKKASLITPPIGGVGPMVVAAVLKNLVDLWT